jgi:hypothetical protein
MVSGTQYSGAGGATRGCWALRNRNVMQSNEDVGLQNNNGTRSRISGRLEPPDGIMPSTRNSRHCGHERSTLAPIGDSELNDRKWYP